MSTTTRAAARTKGLRLAAKVATIGGIAVAALGLVEARAASAASTARVMNAPGGDVAVSAAADDAKPLPMEGWAKAAQGGCGCSPCWGPPAPPRKSGSQRGRARARTTRKKQATKRGAR